MYRWQKRLPHYDDVLLFQPGNLGDKTGGKYKLPLTDFQFAQGGWSKVIFFSIVRFTKGMTECLG